MRMRLVFLPINQRWAFVFGDTLYDLSGKLVRLDVAAGTFYERREEALEHARLCRLRVAESGEVTSAMEPAHV